MFWRPPFRTASFIDTTISKEGVTLSEVLDDDDIIQEGKTQNPKLCDFLSIPEHLRELVQLITTEPSEKMEEKVRFKYPNIACELLCSNMGNIPEMLISDYLEDLTSFLEGEVPLNPLFSSFSCKVLNFLSRNKSIEIFSYIKMRPDIFHGLLKHIGTSSCMDLLLQLVTTGEHHHKEMVSWFNEQGLIQSLVQLIHAGSNPELCYNASQLLVEIQRVEKECFLDTLDNSILIQVMESEEIIDQILKNILLNASGPSRTTCLQCGISFLQVLLQPMRSADQLVYPDFSLPIPFGSRGMGISSSLESLNKTKEVSLSQGGKNVLNLVSRYVMDFQVLLCDSPEILFKGVPVLGYRRLVIIKLLTVILQVSPAQSHSQFISSGLIQTLLHLFLNYPWNNFLHTQVESILKTLLTPITNSEEDKVAPADDSAQLTPNREVSESEPAYPTPSESFKLLLVEGQLVEKILLGWELNRESLISNRKRMGYMGHLTNITNKINEIINSDQNLMTLFTECIQDELYKKWEQLLCEDLKEQNLKNESKMGGDTMNPNFSPPDEDAPTDPILHQAYLEYQLYTVATNFEESFGPEDELVHEDITVNPFSELDSFEFSLNIEEDKAFLDAFLNMCNETIDTFNEPNFCGELYDSTQSSDTDDWLSHPIEHSDDYSKNLGICDIDSDDDDDEDEDDNDSLVPEKIKSSCTDSSDMIETHIIYTQSADKLSNQMNSLDFNPLMLQKENLGTGEEMQHHGLSWPLDDRNDENSWAEFGPFSDISSSDPLTEDMGVFDLSTLDNAVGSKEGQDVSDGNNIIDDDPTLMEQTECNPVNTAEQSEVKETSAASSESLITNPTADSEGDELIDIQKANLEDKTEVTNSEEIPPDEHASGEVKTIEDSNDSLDVVDLNMNTNNNNNLIDFDDILETDELGLSTEEEDNFFFLNSLGLLQSNPPFSKDTISGDTAQGFYPSSALLIPNDQEYSSRSALYSTTTHLDSEYVSNSEREISSVEEARRLANEACNDYLRATGQDDSACDNIAPY